MCVLSLNHSLGKVNTTFHCHATFIDTFGMSLANYYIFSISTCSINVIKIYQETGMSFFFITSQLCLLCYTGRDRLCIMIAHPQNDMKNTGYKNRTS